MIWKKPAPHLDSGMCSDFSKVSCANIFARPRLFRRDHLLDAPLAKQRAQ
jgi:hypothetical protein